MEEKRRFIRFFSHLKARYLIQEDKKGWEECTIINASLNGMSLKFPSSQKMEVGSTIRLEVSLPTELEPINLVGVLKWIEEGMNYFVGGIEYTISLDNDQFAKLGLFQ